MPHSIVLASMVIHSCQPPCPIIGIGLRQLPCSNGLHVIAYQVIFVGVLLAWWPTGPDQAAYHIVFIGLHELAGVGAFLYGLNQTVWAVLVHVLGEDHVPGIYMGEPTEYAIRLIFP